MTPSTEHTIHARREPREFTPDDRAALTQLLRRLHFYAGILVGPFLLVAAITGTLYAFAPTAENLLHSHELRASSSAPATGLDRQLAATRAHEPHLQVTGVVVGAPGQTTRVLFADPTLDGDEGYRRAVFVDPATAEVRGDLPVYGTSQSLPERAWLSQMHRRLHLGEPGRIYSELAASWLAPITLAGLWLWWRQRRTPASGRSTSARGRALRRHSTVGVVIALGLLFLSATGLTWSKYTGAHVSQLRSAMDWKTPSVSTALAAPAAPASPTSAAAPKASAAASSDASMAGMDMPGATPSGAAAPDASHSSHAGHSGHEGHEMPAATPPSPASGSSLIRVNRAAADAGLRAPYEITPGGAGTAWKVKEARRSWTVGPDAIAVDPSTGKVTDRTPFSSFPLAAKLTDWGIRAHMGFLFGLANQLLLAALGLALCFVVVHGYRMWWLRRPTRREGFAMGRPPVRGSLARLFRARPVAMGLATVLVAALGWAVPLLGLSLLGFLLLDSAITSGRRVGEH